MYNFAKKIITQVKSNITSNGLIGGIGLALLILLIFPRVSILKAELAQLSVFGAIQTLVVGSRQDFALVLLLTSFFLGVSLLLKTSSGKRRMVMGFWVVASLTLLWGMANVEIVRLLGEPFTLDWLYYSDFLVSNDAISGILFSVTPSTLIMGLLAWGAFVLSSVVLALVLKRLLLVRFQPQLVFLLVAAASIPLLLNYDTNASLPKAKTLNPVVAFIASLIFQRQSAFVVPPNGSIGLHKLDEQPTALGDSEPLRPFAPIIKNVIFFVLESTPAEYIQNYQGAYPVTPNLLKYKNSSIRFDNIYAHAPATNFSLVSLLTSMYPKLTSGSITWLHPDLPMVTISKILAEKGHQTSFFVTGDIRFDSGDKFLANKSFDKIEDFRSWQCKSGGYQHSKESWKYMDLPSDVCTVDVLTSWIDQNPSKPFFSTIWTGLTHYPYITDGEVQTYTKDENLNRYLNALKIGDEAFGNLMKYLEDKKLIDSTLVVVLGDHGEAFGQHGTFVHASGLYEENLHIPLMFINSKLFNGQTSSEIGGMVDIAPTVLNILNITSPTSWQGESLFSLKRSNRVFFFAPWNGFQVGFRQGNRKVILNSDNEEIQIFDLSLDPMEKDNLAKYGSNLSNDSRQTLANWMQYQNSFFENYVNKNQISENSESNVENDEASSPSAATAPTLAAQEAAKACFTKTLTVAAAGSYLDGAPEIKISVNDKDLGNVELADDSTSLLNAPLDLGKDLAAPIHSFNLPFNTAVNHIEIQFTNDLWKSAKEDRNVNIHQVLLDDEPLTTKDVNFEPPDSGWVNAHGVIQLFKSGSAIFKGDVLRNCH